MLPFGVTIPATVPQRSCDTTRVATHVVSQELDYRIDICRVTKGAHIEHL
jgi:hypothetical protein